MRTMDDRELLEAYVRDRSEAAFGELVRRHLAWVYSVALRHVGSSSLAEEVAQSVFVLLARKATSLRSGTILGGWLFRTTRFVADRAWRAEQRRQHREDIAASMIPSINPQDDSEALWKQLAPHLDQAVAALSEIDRAAILLRFYEKKPLLEVGRRLGLSEEAAKKRVSRAIEKMKSLLAQRGVALGGTALAGLLAEQTVQAVPLALVSAVSKTAMAGVSASGALPLLAQETLRAWQWAKLKIAAGIAAGAVACLVFMTNALSSREQGVGGFSPLTAAGATASQTAPEELSATGKESLAADTAAARTVLFVVRDAATDKSISQAEIHVNYVANREWSRKDDLATGDQGMCQVPIPEGLGRLDIGVLKDGYEERFATWRADVGDAFPALYTMRLRKAGPAIGGSVRDESGQPVARAEIVVLFEGIGDSSSREPSRERLGFINDLTVARTDGMGHWASSVVPVDCVGFTVRARHPGFASTAVNISPQRTDRHGAEGITLEDLRGMQAVIVLRARAPITGFVRDERGQPVAGANVWAGFGQTPDAQTVTDKSGRFVLERLDGVRPVTVMAEGFAIDQQSADPFTSSGPLEFRLSPAPVLSVQVVDEDGRPVPGAEVALENWWGRRGTVDFRKSVDDEGRLEWLSAPKDELEFCALKPGYRYSRENKLAADGKPHTLVLRSVLVVTGKVTDAETGEPVAHFKAIPGYARQPLAADTASTWERNERRFGTNGFYQLTLTEEGIPKVRIEADGYEVAEGEPQFEAGLQATYDVQLRRLDASRLIQGAVFLPDGTSAEGVEVALCTDRCGVMLEGATFQKRLFGNSAEPISDYRCRTGPKGEFRLAPKPRAHTVVAVGEAGLGQTRCFDLSKPLEIRLQPWGRVTGTVRTRDGQWGGRTVKWGRTGNLTSWMTLFYDSKWFSATSDATGKFILERVPPGDGRVAVEDDFGTAPILSPAIRVEPGRTLEVQIGGVGRPVTGRLVAPPGVEVRNWTNQVTFAQLHVEWDSYHIPEDLTGNAAERWKLEFEDTEAGRAWFRAQYSYGFKVGADGSFAIPEVLPGKYRLFVNVGKGYLGSGLDSSPNQPGGRRIASTAMKVTVPDGETAVALALGEVLLIAD